MFSMIEAPRPKSEYANLPAKILDLTATDAVERTSEENTNDSIGSLTQRKIILKAIRDEGKKYLCFTDG